MKYRILLLPLAVVACSQTSEGPGTRAAPAAASASAAGVTASTNAAAGAASSDVGLLGQYHWQLNNAMDSKGRRIDALFVANQKPLQLDFSADRLTVLNACNNMAAGYRIDKGRLLIGPMTTTMMACPDPALGTLDDAIARRLRGSVNVSLLARDDTPSLQLVTDSGDTLNFNGVRTAQTRFGGPGETAFLEVAPQTVPCTHPLMPDKECLLVRERHFDAQGLPTGTPGEWRPLYQPIEGYTHTPGVRNVLRVKRYNVANPPADASSIAYVLDLVVESEQVGQ